VKLRVIRPQVRRDAGRWFLSQRQAGPVDRDRQRQHRVCTVAAYDTARACGRDQARAGRRSGIQRSRRAGRRQLSEMVIRSHAVDAGVFLE
jgi:hypothetical protein